MTHVDVRAGGGAGAPLLADPRTAYRELDDRTPQIANRLIALGVVPARAMDPPQEIGISFSRSLWMRRR